MSRSAWVRALAVMKRLGIACLMAACRETPTEPKGVFVELNQSALQLRIGERDSVRATVRNRPGGVPLDRPVRWRSGDSTVASVEGGLVRGRAAGTTMIIALVGLDSAALPVEVTPTEFADSVLGPSGGTISLPSGVALHIASGEIESTARIEISVTAADDTAAVDSPSQRVELVLRGLPTSDSIVASLRWQPRGYVPGGTELYFATVSGSDTSFVRAEPDGDPGSLSGASEPPTVGPHAAARAVANAVGFPIGLTLRPEANMTITPLVTEVQSERLCDDVYALERAPNRIAPSAPSAVIILIHGWQPQRRCFSPENRARAFLGRFRDFEDYEPAPMWSLLVEDIGEALGSMSADVDILVFRYPTTLSPAVNAARLLRMIEERPGIPAGPGRVVIGAHSMGGLVARSLDRLDDARRLAGVVTFGTPHLGSKLADDGRVAARILKSDGLLSLATGAAGTGVFESQVPFAERRSRFFAIRGSLPCDALAFDPAGDESIGFLGELLVLYWRDECRAAGYPAPASPGVSVSDAVVSHASAIPVALSAASSFAVPFGTTVRHDGILASSLVTREASRVIKEFVELGPFDSGTHLEFDVSTPTGMAYFGRDFDRAPSVRVVGANGALITSSPLTVRLELQNASGAYLTGARATTEGGIARFPELRILGPQLDGPYALIARPEGPSAIAEAVGDDFRAYPYSTIGAVPNTWNPFVVHGDSVFFPWTYGVAQPSILWGGSTRTGTPTQILSLAGASFGPVAVAGDSLFVLGSQGDTDVLWKVARNGSGLRTVDADFTSGAGDLLVVPGALVYVTRSSAGTLELRRVPISGGAPSVLTTIDGPSTVLAGAGRDVYFSDPSTHSIRRVSIDGGLVSLVVQLVPNTPSSLLTDGSRIYWTDSYDIWSASLATGLAQRFAQTGGNPRVVAAVAGLVYAIHYGDGSTLPASIWRYDAATSARTRVAVSMISGPVHVDATSLFYISWGGHGSSPLIMMSSRFACADGC